jgi:hypothetical protein
VEQVENVCPPTATATATKKPTGQECGWHVRHRRYGSNERPRHGGGLNSQQALVSKDQYNDMYDGLHRGHGGGGGANLLAGLGDGGGLCGLGGVGGLIGGGGACGAIALSGDAARDFF